LTFFNAIVDLPVIMNYDVVGLGPLKASAAPMLGSKKARVGIISITTTTNGIARGHA
jgi:hypothetical protein